jgi:hypothetical protein
MELNVWVSRRPLLLLPIEIIPFLNHSSRHSVIVPYTPDGLDLRARLCCIPGDLSVAPPL